MAELTRTNKPPQAIAQQVSEDRGVIREYLAFVLAGEVYAVALTRIREILSPPPITEVPRAGRDVIGVCSVRGLLVTVVDLRRRMRLEEAPISRRSRILLAIANSGEVVGLMVDEVKQVIRLAEAEIEIAQTVLGGDVSEHVMGIARPASGVVVLLNLGSIVSGGNRG
ncbi:MAG: purine-binding chemotaxis protein CheW [Polyangiaceae bacterium]|nr:purine-binding chemotaxis protein CheW [Myxococcales bacterium]MCB9584864.1 purine-binding chemotaxis protein CheW [Polyangiaceae bacterium]MCB9607563.1 purine-binding chemotaxis protein CheW [Polyangiaceae bacterium]